MSRYFRSTLVDSMWLNESIADFHQCTDICARNDAAGTWNLYQYYQVSDTLGISPEFIDWSSTGCTRPRPGFAIYNASKAAVEVSAHDKYPVMWGKITCC